MRQIIYRGKSNSEEWKYGTLNNALFNGFGFSHKWFFFKPRTAFMFLINAISGKGTWVRNNYHVIYYFKLRK